MKIFVVNGKGGSGKTSFEDFVIKYAERCAAIPIFKTSIIDYVKDIASYAGWDGGKTNEDRKFLHQLKMILSEWNDSPMQEIIGLVQDLEHFEGKNIAIFIDMREPDDIERFSEFCEKEKWEYYTVLVTRDILDKVFYMF